MFLSPVWPFVLDNLSQWTLVFVTMLLEIGICTFIILPFPFSWRRKFLELFARVWNQYPRFRIVTGTWMTLISFLFVDALRKMWVIHVTTTPQIIETPSGISTVDLSSSNLVGNQKDIEVTLMVAERNAFLCGLTVFLWLILYRFQSMMDKLSNLEIQLQKSGVQVSGEVSDEKSGEKPIQLDDLYEHELPHTDRIHVDAITRERELNHAAGKDINIDKLSSQEPNVKQRTVPVTH